MSIQFIRDDYKKFYNANPVIPDGAFVVVQIFLGIKAGLVLSRRDWSSETEKQNLEN